MYRSSRRSIVASKVMRRSLKRPNSTRSGRSARAHGLDNPILSKRYRTSAIRGQEHGPAYRSQELATPRAERPTENLSVAQTVPTLLDRGDRVNPSNGPFLPIGGDRTVAPVNLLKGWRLSAVAATVWRDRKIHARAGGTWMPPSPSLAVTCSAPRGRCNPDDKRSTARCLGGHTTGLSLVGCGAEQTVSRLRPFLR